MWNAVVELSHQMITMAPADLENGCSCVEIVSRTFDIFMPKV